MHRIDRIDHRIEEWINNTIQNDITFQEAYTELPIEYKTDNPKRINYLNLIWLREKMYREAIEETRKNILRTYPEPIPDPIQSPEDILINMEEIRQYHRENSVEG